MCKRCLRCSSGFDDVEESDNDDDFLIFLRVVIRGFKRFFNIEIELIN